MKRGEASLTETNEYCEKAPDPARIELVCAPIFHGIMAYWDKMEEAASYCVRLWIRTEETEFNRKKVTHKELASVLVERNFAYHSFLNLASIASRGMYDKIQKCYCVSVEAEDRTGRIIGKSEKVEGYILRYQAPSGGY